MIALLAAVLSSPAGAQQPPASTAPPGVLPITVALTDNAVGHAAQVGWIVESVLRDDERHRLLDPVEKFDREGMAARREKASLGQAELNFGRRAYRNLDPGMGASSFDRALASFEDSPLWETFPSLVEAMTMRIIVRWQEDPSSARRELGRLLTIAPEVKFPDEFTPPDLRAEVERARDSLVAETRFSLDVNAQPVAARVYVDGVYRGTTPVSVRGLLGGEHHVSLVAPGHVVYQEKVRVMPGASTSVALQPAERARPFLTFVDRLREGFGRDEEVSSAQTLGRVSAADQVLVAGISREQGRVTVQLHRIAVSDGHALSVRTVRIPEGAGAFTEQVTAAVGELLSTDRPRGRNGEPLPVRGAMEGLWDNLDERAVTIGTGVASGALLLAGGTLGLVAYGQNATFRRMEQTNPLVDERAASGFRTALAADILVGAGLVGAATWAWMQFGRKHARRADFDAPPVLERSRRDDDPFALHEPRALDPVELDNDEEELRPRHTVEELVRMLPGGKPPRPEWKPYAGASQGAVLFGVKGGF